MSLKLITGPTEEPISLQEAKLHLRVIADVADVAAHPEDAAISAMIAAARQSAEHITGRAMMPQTWELALDEFEPSIYLPKPPLVSVTSVKYLDDDGVSQTLDPAVYFVDDYGIPAKLTPAYGESWPSTRRQANAVMIRYQAGYANAAAVPQEIKAWMLLKIGMLYANRESVAVGVSVAEVPHVDRLLDSCRVWSM